MAATRRTNPESPYAMAFPSLDAATMQGAAEAYKAWMQCLMAVNTETAKFLTHRLQCDAQLPLSIVQCHNPQDIMQAQIEFFKTMAEDYSKQANKMGRIVSESFHSIDRPPTLAWPQPEEPGAIEHRKAA